MYKITVQEIELEDKTNLSEVINLLKKTKADFSIVFPDGDTKTYKKEK